MKLLPNSKILRRISRHYPNPSFPFAHPHFPFRHKSNHEILCDKWNQLGYYHYHAGKFLSSFRFKFPHADFEEAYYRGRKDAFYEFEDDDDRRY